MTPEQEDALVESSIADATIRTGAVSVNFDFRDAIRLAIRAAYARGREDAAKVCERPLAFGEINQTLIDAAAAIRRGE